MKKPLKTPAVQAATMVVCLLFASNADAEIRTITATGEYRMGDNDTRTDAKRLALLDAKRLALEQAGTYIESITQVKNFDLSKEEIRAYTAGIVEVVEQATKDIMEGSTHIIRVDVTAKIDTDLVARQVDALRKDELLKTQLVHAREEINRLRQELEGQTKELSIPESQSQVEAIVQQRQEGMTKLEAANLLVYASALLAESKKIEQEPGEKLNSDPKIRAKRLTEQALSLDWSNPLGHSLMGYLLFEERNYEAAMREHREALRLDHNFALAQYGLGLALQGGGDVTGAMAAFREAIRLNPSLPDPHAALGHALLGLKDLPGAAIEFREALRLNPNDESALFGLGEALSIMGDWLSGSLEFRKLTLLKPRDPATHIALGTALHGAGDFSGAIAEFRQALRLDANSARAHHGLGRALTATHSYHDAIREFRTALQIKPDLAPAHRDLGLALLLAGDKSAAIGAVRTAISIDSSDADTHLIFGHVLGAEGRWSESVQELREYLKLVRYIGANQARIEEAKDSLRRAERLAQRPSSGCSSTAEASNEAYTEIISNLDVGMLVPLWTIVFLMARRWARDYRLSLRIWKMSRR